MERAKIYVSKLMYDGSVYRMIESSNINDDLMDNASSFIVRDISSLLGGRPNWNQACDLWFV